MQAEAEGQGRRQPEERAVLALPEQRSHAQNDRVKHEQQGMQPLLGRPAMLRVNQLVLGDEQARERGERDKATERRG